MDLEPFDMFCVYHLHITPDNRYKKKIRQREINGYFECSGDEFHDTLRRYGMDRKSVHRSGFDISLARLDMRVAPEGLDKRELARVLFDEFLEKNPGVRTFLGESGAAQTG
jgi:hypothetical protein